MNILKRLLFIGLSMFLFSIQGMAEDKGPATRKVSAVDKAKRPPTEMERLQSRIVTLEREVERLISSAPKSGRAPAKVTRLKKDDKADSPQAMQTQINRLWDQITIILNKLDELAAKS